MATSKPGKGTSNDSKGLKSQSHPSVFILKVELVDSEPVICRRIYIDGRARLNAFHHILQAAMGWTDSHLHEFTIREKRYAPPNEEDQFLEIETLDESETENSDQATNPLDGLSDTVRAAHQEYQAHIKMGVNRSLI